VELRHHPGHDREQAEISGPSPIAGAQSDQYPGHPLKVARGEGDNQEAALSDEAGPIRVPPDREGSPPVASAPTARAQGPQAYSRPMVAAGVVSQTAAP